MEVSHNLGGIPAVTAVGVVVAGLQGSVFGYLVLKKLRVKHQEAIGLICRGGISCTWHS